MSRTFRRKKDEWLKRRYVDFWFSEDGEICPRFKHWANKEYHGCSAKQIREKQTAYWCGDGPSFSHSPRGYAETCRRQHRAALNQNLIREIKKRDDYEDVYLTMTSKNYLIYRW